MIVLLGVVNTLNWRRWWRFILVVFLMTIVRFLDINSHFGSFIYFRINSIYILILIDVLGIGDQLFSLRGQLNSERVVSSFNSLSSGPICLMVSVLSFPICGNSFVVDFRV